MHNITAERVASSHGTTVQPRAEWLLSLVHDRNGIVAAVGNTPLIRIHRAVSLPPGVEVYAKAEWFNPGGSVKDRPVVRMLVEAERSGELRPGKTIIDATSGNTGIAYAMFGSALGYRVALALPSNAGRERLLTLKAYGAEVILTDPLQGTDGARKEVLEIVRRDPLRYFYPDQYNNDANWRAHYEGTAEEIWSQTRGRVTHFVAGLGTTGTFIGTARRLKKFNPSIVCIAFEPESPMHGIEGLKHLATSVVPGIFDPGVADEHLQVSTEEAHAMTRRLARTEGLFAGVSSGAALAVARGVAERLDKGVIVTIFPDGGSKYTGESFWNDIDEKA